MPGTSSTIYLPTDPRERRRVLRYAPTRNEPCGVPGCDELRVTDDCCRTHSQFGPGKIGDTSLVNDGIIDWVAIDVAARGLRPVRLTWVEKDIAVGTILASGEGITAAQERTGARVASNGNTRRVQAAWKIAEAIKRTSNKESND